MADIKYPTPHIKATPEDFAKTVLMPGDPLRAKFVADNFLENPRLVNNVRGIQGYTGTYDSVPVSVMASGMGIPSMAIYSEELFNVFGVENIIRMGTAGGISDDVKLRDIVIAMGCSTNSNYIYQFGLPGTYAPLPDYGLLSTVVDICEKRGTRYKVGNVLSSDVFYNADNKVYESWRDMGILAVEMETASLYCNAARAGKRALAIYTVSDHIFTGECLSADERHVTVTEMMTVALETAKKISTE